MIVDIRMPPIHSTEGLDAAGAIREEFPDIGILVLSAYVDVEQAMELLATGQRIGYLLTSRVTGVGEFIETIERIANGGSVVDPALVKELVSARRVNDPLATCRKARRPSPGPGGRHVPGGTLGIRLLWTPNSCWRGVRIGRQR